MSRALKGPPGKAPGHKLLLQVLRVGHYEVMPSKILEANTKTHLSTY